MKKILLWSLIATTLISLLSLGILSAAAAEPLTGSCGDQVTWTLDTDTGELVISGRGPMSDYTIMDMPPWRNHSNSITSVTVEEGVTAIGVYSFFYCSNLTDVSLPDSLTSIGSNAFAGCSKLERIRIPEGLTQIGVGTFQNCSSLTEIALPSDVTEIPVSSFLGCSALTSVSLPPQVTVIGEQAFLNCSSLTEAVLPAKLNSIGNKAFSGCSMLETVSLPSSLTSLGNDVFASTPLRMALFEGDEDAWKAIQVGTGNTSLTDVLVIHPDHTFDREAVDPLYLADSANCENAESYYRSCACGAVGTEIFFFGDPLGHVGGKATCTAYAICEVCGASYGDLLPHTPDGVADCTLAVHCAVCSTLLEEALGHACTDTVSPPTCIESGYTTHTCTRCDYTYDDSPVDPLGHVEGDAATCTADQICTVCHAVLTEKLGHDYVPEITLAPTCTEEGLRTYTCSRCNDVYRETITPVGHTEGAPATCTAPQLCTVCLFPLADKLSHEYTVSTVEATCTARGYTVHTCSYCAHSYLDNFTDTKEHTPGTAATCITPQLCTECGTMLIAALGHDYTHDTIEATCEMQGYMVHTCSRCDHFYMDTFTQVREHTPDKAPSCQEPQVCTDCGILLSYALGHDYRATIVDPTCDSQGYILHVCARCTASYPDTFTPAKQHTPGDAPTCSTPEVCTVCNIVLTPAFGHDYEDKVTSATCTEAGYVIHACRTCGITYVGDPIAPNEHTPGEPASCHAPQTCTVCHAHLADRLTHAYEETVTDPTCTADGQVVHTCSLCGDSYIQAVLPATGHTPGNWEIDNQPDVGEPGRRHKSCDACNEILEAETFWTSADDGDDPETDPSRVTASDSEPFEKGGCRLSGGNIAVIVIVLIAAFLLWFVDLRRR